LHWRVGSVDFGAEFQVVAPALEARRRRRFARWRPGLSGNAGRALIQFLMNMRIFQLYINIYIYIFCLIFWKLEL